MSFYDLSQSQLPRALQTQNTPQDPEWWYDQVANNPWPISELYQMKINQQLRKEAKRRDQDLYQNTGQSWKNSPYPFMAYSGSFSGRNNYGAGDMFEATEKIVSLYYNRWKRW